MPASARNSVDLPEPERPVMTTEWPGSSIRSASVEQLRPVRQLEREVAHLHRSVRRIGQRQPGAECGARGDDRTMERREPLDDGVPLGQVGIAA